MLAGIANALWRFRKNDLCCPRKITERPTLGSFETKKKNRISPEIVIPMNAIISAMSM